MAQFKIDFAGVFFIKVLDKYYPIASINLLRTLNKYTMGDIQVSDLDTHIGNGSRNKSLGNVSQLYQIVAAVAPGQAIQCSIEQVLSSKQIRPILKGVIASFSYNFSSASGVKSTLSLKVTGHTSKLNWGYMIDFKYVSAQLSGKYVMSKAQKQAYDKISYWGKAQSLCDMALRSMQDLRQDTIDMLFHKAFHQIQQQRFRYGINVPGDPTFTSTVNLSEYLTSKYRVADFISDMVGTGQNVTGNIRSTLNPYLVAFDSSFCNGLQRNVILSSIQATLNLNHLCYRPVQGIQSPQKLDIIPSYNYSNQIYKQPLPAVRMYSSTDLLSRLRLPDTIVVDVSPASQWGVVSKTIGDSGLFGYYTTLPQKSKDMRKQTSVAAPYWLYQSVIAQCGKNMPKDKAKNKKAADAKKQDQSTKMQDNKKIQQTLNKYAKTVYYSMFSTDIGNATIWCNYSYDLYKTLFQKIGDNFYLQFTISSGSSKKVKKYYGRLKEVSFSYMGSQAPQQASSASIVCSFTAVTQQDSIASSLYKQPMTDLLYVAKG